MDTHTNKYSHKQLKLQFCLLDGDENQVLKRTPIITNELLRGMLTPTQQDLDSGLLSPKLCPDVEEE